MKKVFAVLSLIGLTYMTHAQTQNEKRVEEREQLWLGYFSTIKLTSKWGLWSDVHYRLTDHFIDNKFQFITHNGVTYFLKEDVRLTAGYTYSYLFEEGNLPGRPEHRPWEQLWWRQNYDGFQLVQWIRAEQRYRRKTANGELTDEYSFNHRFRYNLSLFVPLKGKKMTAKTPFFILMDEIFINAGKEIKYNYFDNNRFFIGLGYQFTKHFNMHLGYMNLFQQQANGIDYINTHAIRCFAFQTFDLRKKEPEVH